jgi:hypothetical protein
MPPFDCMMRTREGLLAGFVAFELAGALRDRPAAMFSISER